MTDIATFLSLGTCKHYTSCRFCFSKNLITCIELGYVPLAGGFLATPQDVTNEKSYPLEVAFCEDCFLLQSVNVVDKNILFKDYFYHSSSIRTLQTHFTRLADEFEKEVESCVSPFIVEVGCNDGTLIKALTEKNIHAIGVDPADNIVQPLIKKGMPIIDDYFTESIASKIKKQYGGADIICSFNVLAHIEDMHDVFRGIKTLLKDDGILIMETHYLGTLLKEMQYDMIYHEHQYYYSLMTLMNFFAQFEMEVYDVTPVPIHAGSMRYYVKHKKSMKHPATQNVSELLKKEKQQKLDEINTYKRFNRKLEKVKKELLSLVTNLKKGGKTIVGYGASGRGTIIMNYTGLDKTLLDYVIDDAPAKQEALTPGNHLMVKPSSALLTNPMPDFALLFAWSFIDEIKKRNETYLKNGGKFILPLPRVKVIS